MVEFNALLDSYVDDSKDRAAVVDEIWRRFGTDGAALNVDLCGFARTAGAPDGLLNFLGLIRRMQRLAPPVIEAAGGSMVKMEADNCFAVFTTPLAAADAAFRLIDAANALESQDGLTMDLCCGLEAGPMLLLPGKDFFGHSVNVACKLGEDVAGKDEVLAGPAARAILDAAGWPSQDLDDPTAPAGSARISRPSLA